MVHACATCASTFDHPFDPASEKPLLVGRDLPCCGRSICSRCLNQNKRYETYCPYCQITTDPSSLLPQGLRDPPAYDTAANEKKLPESEEPNRHDPDDVLPAYSEHHTNPSPLPSEKHPPHHHDLPAQDVLHFVTPNDSIRSLSLAYQIPIPALRKSNNIYSDHLLQARRTVLIPGEYYKAGVSLSPRPVEGEEEEIRKGKVRRWMMGCKVAEYVIFLSYPSLPTTNMINPHPTHHFFVFVCPGYKSLMCFVTDTKVFPYRLGTTSHSSTSSKPPGMSRRPSRRTGTMRRGRLRIRLRRTRRRKAKGKVRRVWG